MDALDLLQSLVGAGQLKPSRAKDFKTALNKLADACHVPLESLDLSTIRDTYQHSLQTYFAKLTPPATAHTTRNTLQNLIQLYRLAIDHGYMVSLNPQKLRRLPSMKTMTDTFRQTSPYRHVHSGGSWRRYACTLAQCSPDIQRGWNDYVSRKGIEIRPISLRGYRYTFLQYMGYNLAHESPPPEQWDQLFEIPRILRAIRWHADRAGADRISRQGNYLAILLHDIAKHQDRADFAALQKFRKGLPPLPKVYDKQAPIHTVSLFQVDQVGVSLLEEARHVQMVAERTGMERAVRFATGLQIRFMVRCPRRSREIREMDLGGRLYQDDAGQWQLRYLSHQLKVAEHFDRPNEFRIPWPIDLVPDLEEYLRDYRPKLLTRQTCPWVFPSAHGKQLTIAGLRNRVVGPCFAKLGKHIYPHLLRTLWTDAYLDAHPGDYEGAAAMLNDTPETVQGWYRQFRVEQQMKKATDFNAQLFGNGLGKGRTR